MRQRAHERLDQRRRIGEARRRIDVLARMCALEGEFIRVRRAEQARLASAGGFWGPPRGDAE